MGKNVAKFMGVTLAATMLGAHLTGNTVESNIPPKNPDPNIKAPNTEILNIPQHTRNDDREDETLWKNETHPPITQPPPIPFFPKVNDIKDYLETYKYTRELYNKKKLFSLQDAVNSYPLNSTTTLLEYLKTSTWYKSYTNDQNKTTIDTILKLTTSPRRENQPLQCMGFAMMASKFFPELNIQYIGGTSAKNVRDLLPEEFTTTDFSRIRVSSIESGGIALAGPLKLENYMPGDLSILRDTSKLDSITGYVWHILVILETKIDENGKISLLVADSNKNKNGRISIYEINQDNVNTLLGNGNRYIIRSQENYALSQLE